MYIKRIIIISILILIYTSIVFAQTLTSNNYSILNPRTASFQSKSSSSNYILNNVIIGNVTGGSAESANFVLQTYLFQRRFSTDILSISLNPTSWLLSSVTPGQSKITLPNEKITVVNDGTIKASYSLQVIDERGTWQAASALDGNILNRYLMSGIFTDVGITEVDDTYFNELGDEDLILESTPQTSTAVKFGTISSAKTGVGVLSGEERTLWLKFTAPQADTTQQEHDIWVIVGAEISE